MPSDLVLAIINAEESARETNKNTNEHFKKFKTNIIDWKDFIIDPLSGSYIFLDKQKEGSIEEFVIISPTDKFSLLVMADNVTTYQGEFSRFQEITTHISSVVAKQRGSQYILQLSDLSFVNSIRIIIDVQEKTTFDRLYCKYNLEV